MISSATYDDQFEEIVWWHQGSKSCLPIQQIFFQNLLKKLVSLFHLNTFTTEEQTSSSCSLWLSPSHTTLHSQAKRCVTKTDCVTMISYHRVSVKSYYCQVGKTGAGNKGQQIFLIFDTSKYSENWVFFQDFSSNKIMISRKSAKKIQPPTRGVW